MYPFHYAFKVKDLASTRRFYVEIMGCAEGRSTNTWIDFNFFGHQLSAHISDAMPPRDYCGQVDGIQVPIPHFGCILAMEDFLSLQEIFEREAVEFVVKPQRRYEGKPGEQLTMFVFDFSGNPLEFKAFINPDDIFSM